MSATTDGNADCPDCQFPASAGHDEFCQRFIAAEQERAEAEVQAERIASNARNAAEHMQKVQAMFRPVKTPSEWPSMWSCKECGSVVDDRDLHFNFHVRLNRRPSETSSVGPPVDDPRLAGYGTAPRSWGSWPR